MINWECVNELRNEVGYDDFLEVVDIFLEEVEEVVTRLRNFPDPETFEHDLHFLKGSAMNLGFDNLAAACQVGENLAADNKTNNVEIGAILSIYEQSKIEFNGGTQMNILVA